MARTLAVAAEGVDRDHGLIDRDRDDLRRDQIQKVGQQRASHIALFLPSMTQASSTRVTADINRVGV